MNVRPFTRLLPALAGLLAAGLALAAGPTNSVLVSPRSSVGFGSSLVGGDFNGDGFGDLLIAEAAPTSPQPPRGSLRLHLGSTNGITPEPTAVVTNLSFHLLHFLTTSPGATDFDGDGCADVALTSQRWVLPGGTLLTNNTAVILSGRALSRGQVEALWIGTQSTGTGWTLPNGSPVHVLFPGPTHPESQGICFAVGDLDHDGHAEFAFKFPAGPVQNEVYVVWGRAAGSGKPHVTALADQGAGFGSAVAPWPDQDGDGVADLAIAATSVSTRVLGGGEVEFWAVDANRSARRSAFTLETPLPPIRPPSDHAMQHFGASMVLLGPAQTPDRAELLVSAPWAEDGDIDEGVVRLYRPARSGRPAQESGVLEGDRAYGKFGTQMIVPATSTETVGRTPSSPLPKRIMASSWRA